METKNTTENKSEQKPSGDFDINSLLNNPNLMEILKHLLSGGGAMAGNYFIWIKPMQEKIEAMSKKISEQEKQIKELQEDQRELLRSIDEKEEPYSMSGKSQDYFNLNRDYSNKDHARERTKRRMRSQYI